MCTIDATSDDLSDLSRRRWEEVKGVERGRGGIEVVVLTYWKTIGGSMVNERGSVLRGARSMYRTLP